MASDPDQEAKLATLLGQLANTRPDLGLELDNAGREFVPLAAIPKMELDRWLADTATLAEGIDERTAAAYLLSILVWKLGEILAALHLGGAILEIDVAVQYAVSGSGRSRDIQFHFAVSTATRHGSCQRSINQAIVDLHEPLVNALFDRTGLSRRALWRLVTDGIAGGFLERGKRSGDTDRARRGQHSAVENRLAIAQFAMGVCRDCRSWRACRMVSSAGRMLPTVLQRWRKLLYNLRRAASR